MPLAELLGVTVTELLLCRRMPTEDSMDSGQVESVVKTALAYEGGKTRAYQIKSGWPLAYLVCGIAGAAVAVGTSRLGMLSDTALTGMVLGLIFGGYFCFFVKTRLPAEYDRNAWGFYWDGPFRLNVPGVRLTNGNWPHVVQVGRVWSCGAMVLSPVLDLAGNALLGTAWPGVRLWVWLAVLLGGLFLPMYVVGKKYG